MKKLLYSLLIFVSCNTPQYENIYAQVSAVQVAAGYNTGGVGLTSFGAHSVGDLFIAIAGTTNAGGTPATISLSGTNQTWTQIGNQLNVAGTARIQAFRWAPTTTVGSGASVSYSYSGTQDGGWVIIYRIAGANTTGTNGSNGVAQVVTNSANASANPSLTMASIANGSNSVISAFINNANPFGGTAEAGWTEDEDSGYNTPTTGGYSMSRNATTDNTPTVTAAASDWGGIAIEIAAAATRRIITTN